MADYQLILEHVAKSEGGLSSDPNDSCSKVPSNIKNPKTGNFYHTNKGVCYSTWIEASKKYGFDSSGKGFVNMTTGQWQTIIKGSYWDPLNLDKVNNQAIAELIFETNWGSGLGGARPLIRHMQQIINVPINGKMDSTTLVKLNNYTNQKTATTALYQSLWTFRLNWLKSLSQWSRYGKGWSNRMNELYERSKGMFTNPKFLGIFVLLGVSLFFLIKKR